MVNAAIITITIITETTAIATTRVNLFSVSALFFFILFPFQIIKHSHSYTFSITRIAYFHLICNEKTYFSVLFYTE